MIKDTQKQFRWRQPTNYLSMFDHFVSLVNHFKKQTNKKTNNKHHLILWKGMKCACKNCYDG